MTFDIITIFPDIFDSYFNESIIKRARAKSLVDIRIHDLRKFARGKHKKNSPALNMRKHFGRVDDRPFGGGPGMVLKVEPIVKALGKLLKPSISNFQFPISKQISKSKFQKSKTKIILFSAAGKQFDAKMVRDFSKNYKRIIMICGHYEGVDERIKSIIHDSGFIIQEISIGPYVLTGGELPAMIVVDAVIRHIPSVLGRGESLEETRHGVGVPSYTRPEVVKWRGKKFRVPRVLLSGNHKKIEEWRKGHKK